MVKTMSRVFYEKIYKRKLITRIPAIKELFPFNQLLTGNLAEMIETHYDIIKAVITPESMTVLEKLIGPISGLSLKGKCLLVLIGSVSPTQILSFDYEELDYIMHMLFQINLYGHSFVLTAKTPKKLCSEFTKEELVRCLDGIGNDTFVNIEGKSYFIEISGHVEELETANKTYQYRRVSYSEYNHRLININFFVPIDNDVSKIFISTKNVHCLFDCPNKVCHSTRVEEIRCYEYHSNKLGNFVPDRNLREEIVDFRTRSCNPQNCCINAIWYSIIPNLIYVMNEYNKFTEHNTSSKRKHNTTGVQKCITEQRQYDNSTDVSSLISIVENDDTETYIPLKRKQSNTGENGGHTHNSPGVHMVNGFWRRRSKNDPTLIFVEPFARGGSAKEREIVNKHLYQKQQVHSI